MSTNPAVQPDAPAIAAFVQAIFGHARGYVPVRKIREKGAPDAPPVSIYLPANARLSAQRLREARSAARDARGLYIVPGTVVAPGSAKAIDIAQLTAVLVDLDDGDTTAHRLTDAMEGRPVVAGDDQLEARAELEEITADEAHPDRIAAGHGLDPGLGPAASALGFCDRDEPRTAEAGQIGGVPVEPGAGERLERRLHVVPFGVTFTEEQRDRTLAERLLAERDGILGWIIEGCLAWQRLGLDPPRAVRSAADEYFADEDTTGQWIAESCRVGPGEKATARELFESWSAWARDNGIEPSSQKTLGEVLRGRGLVPGKVGPSRGWIGIAPRSAS